MDSPEITGSNGQSARLFWEVLWLVYTDVCLFGNPK
jgi:hypothetical protein